MPESVTAIVGRCIRWESGSVRCERPTRTWERTRALVGANGTQIVTATGEVETHGSSARPPRPWLRDVAHLTRHGNGLCAATSSGGVTCWSADGRRGVDGPATRLLTSRRSPQTAESSCALQANGTLHCWADGAPLTGTGSRVSQLTVARSKMYALVDGRLRWI